MPLRKKDRIKKPNGFLPNGPNLYLEAFSLKIELLIKSDLTRINSSLVSIRIRGLRPLPERESAYEKWVLCFSQEGFDGLVLSYLG